MKFAVVPTPVGPFGMLADDEAEGDPPVVRAAGFTADPERLLVMLAESRREAEIVAVGHLGQATRAVERYLAGELDALDPVALQWDTEGFRDRAWHAMRAVPAGETISYGELAARAGAAPGDYESARAAGQACARNPLTLFVPCHRINAANGDLHNYGWGLAVKRWLLDHESNQGRLF